MENEKKEKIILNDEELKKVTGGLSTSCKSLKPLTCNRHPLCKWYNGKCVSKYNT